MEIYYDENKRVPGLKSVFEKKYEKEIKEINDGVPAVADNEEELEKLIRKATELRRTFLKEEGQELEKIQAKLTTFSQHVPLTVKWRVWNEEKGEYEESDEDINPCLYELARFAGNEMHNIGAFAGGVAAQGIMKILLKQFFPYNNTYVFNGIHCEGAVFKI